MSWLARALLQAAPDDPFLPPMRLGQEAAEFAQRGWRDEGEHGQLLPVGRASPEASLEWGLGHSGWAKAIRDAMMLPGRAAKGEDYSLEDVTRAAIVLQGLASAGSGPQGSLSTMLGPRGISRRPGGRERLREMAEMERRQADPLEIWRTLGMYRGVEGQPRLYLDDTLLDTRPFPIQTQEREPRAWGEIQDFIHHPELMQAYPEFRDLQVSGRAQAGGVAEFDRDVPGIGLAETRHMPQLDAIGRRMQDSVMNSLILHELQHAIQEVEGLPQGSNPMHILYGILGADELGGHADRLREELARQKEQKPLADQNLLAYNIADEAYHSTAGEVEARLVQEQYKDAMKQRGIMPPFYSREWRNYPPEAQIIIGLGRGYLGPTR